MAAYEFRFLSGSKLIRTCEYHCFDHLDALDKAANVADKCEVQVWQDDKKVAYIAGGIERHNTQWLVAETD